MGALKGTLTADFTDFYTAVQKAEVSLTKFEADAGKVGGALDRMANTLNGTRLVQDATLMSEAVERIGGVSKLTESELARVSGQAKEAAAKLVAMGKDVPPGIQKIADATKSAGSQIDQMKNFATSAAGAFGVAFGIGQVVQFGKSVFDSASKIHDLAEQMGISVEAVQGFKFAAEQAGSSLDTVNTAITKMNANLDGGEKATVDALKKAGLSFQEIRSMKPEDAFLAITDAIQQIKDPMTQSEVALKLFGKSAAELLPAIKEGFRGAADGAAKMSEDTINSLEAAQDAWGKLADKVTIATGTIIAHTMNAANVATSSWGGFGKFVNDAIKGGIGSAMAFADAQDVAAKAAAKNRDVNLSLPGPIHKTKEEMDAAAAAAKRWADALDSAFRKWSGKDIADQMKILDITFRRMADSGQITAQQITAMAEEAAKLATQGAALTPRLTALVLETGALSDDLKTTAIDFKNLGEQVQLTVPWIVAYEDAVSGLQDKLKLGLSGEIGEKMSAPKLEDIIGKTKKETDAIGQLAQAFAQLSQVAGGSLGDIIKDFGTLVAATDTARKSIEAIKGGFSKGGLSGILDMTSGVLGLASAAIAAGRAIAGLFNRDKGRDVVTDFAASMGGFDALHVKLNELGADGERLWIQLTQGVGRNNPDQARAAVEAVTAALDAQAAKQAEATQAAAEGAAAQIQAQQDALDAITARYAGTISKLESEYKTLNDRVSQEAEEAVMGVQETQDRARMAQIDAERAAQEAMRDAEIEAKRTTFEQWYTDGTKVNGDLQQYYRDHPIEIPYSYVPTNAPPGYSGGGGATYTPPSSSSRVSSRGASMLQPITLRLDSGVLWQGLVETVHAADA